MPTEGESTSAWEIYSYLNAASDAANEGDFCGKRLLGWLRYEQNQPDRYQPSSSWMECTSEFLTAKFNVTVDAEGHILRSEQTGPYENITEVLGGNATAVRQLWRYANMCIGGYGAGDTSSAGADLGWHDDTLTRSWMSYFLGKVAFATANNNNNKNSAALVDPREPVPEIDDANNTLASTVENLYQRVGAALLGANLDIFADAELSLSSSTTTTPAALPAVMVTSDTRIFMNETAYTISMTILGIYVLAVASFYVHQRCSTAVLPRMPSTIGSTIAYVAASRAVRVYWYRGARSPTITATTRPSGGKNTTGGGGGGRRTVLGGIPAWMGRCMLGSSLTRMSCRRGTRSRLLHLGEYRCWTVGVGGGSPSGGSREASTEWSNVDQPALE